MEQVTLPLGSKSELEIGWLTSVLPELTGCSVVCTSFPRTSRSEGIQKRLPDRRRGYFATRLLYSGLGADDRLTPRDERARVSRGCTQSGRGQGRYYASSWPADVRFS